MILVFSVGDSMIKVRVDNDRNVFFGTALTAYDWKNIDDMPTAEGASEKDTELFKVIIKSIPKKYVKPYLIEQFGSLGLSFEKEMIDDDDGLINE